MTDFATLYAFAIWLFGGIVAAFCVRDAFRFLRSCWFEIEHWVHRTFFSLCGVEIPLESEDNMDEIALGNVKGYHCHESELPAEMRHAA